MAKSETPIADFIAFFPFDLRVWRKNRNLSYKDLAKEAGVPIIDVFKVLNGDQITLVSLAKLIEWVEKVIAIHKAEARYISEDQIIRIEPCLTDNLTDVLIRETSPDNIRGYCSGLPGKAKKIGF